MLHIPLTNWLLLTAKQEPYKKAHLLTKNTEEFSGKKIGRKGQQAENDKTERVTGLGRRTREETAKWNQMTALRFQTEGRHQTSPSSLRGQRFLKWPHLHSIWEEKKAFCLRQNTCQLSPLNICYCFKTCNINDHVSICQNHAKSELDWKRSV